MFDRDVLGNMIYHIINTEISSRKKEYVKMIRKMHQPIGNANDENSLVKKRRSSNHKRERRKLTSEQHRIVISIKFEPISLSQVFFFQLKNVYKSCEGIN